LTVNCRFHSIGHRRAGRFSRNYITDFIAGQRRNSTPLAAVRISTLENFFAAFNLYFIRVHPWLKIYGRKS
jgi:hypothetical protein